MALSAQ